MFIKQAAGGWSVFSSVFPKSSTSIWASVAKSIFSHLNSVQLVYEDVDCLDAFGESQPLINKLESLTETARGEVNGSGEAE